MHDQGCGRPIYEPGWPPKSLRVTPPWSAWAQNHDLKLHYTNQHPNSGGGGKLLDHWIISWWLDVYFAELRGFWSILQKSYRKNVAKIQRQGTIFAIHADNARRNWDCILSNSCRIVLGEDATWYWSRQVVARGWQFLDESSKRSGGNTFENTPSETSREMS